MIEPWADEPINSEDEDDLDRTPYAMEAARLIAESDPSRSSIVFGLTGAWGSGKSSMLNLIQGEIEKSYPTWRVARFTPWATSDLHGLLGDFYASLSTALPARQGKRLRKSLGVLAQVAAPAGNLIPWGGGAAAAAAKMTGDMLLSQEPWDKAFKKAEQALLELKTPILIIADDIDRLQTPELLTLLKVVRLLGRFKGVHYLLAYDEATLLQTLSASNLIGGESDAAARFLEKIIQYPFVVPPLLETPLIDRLDSGIDKVVADAGRRPLTSGRLSVLRRVYLSQLSTPRAIDRYLAQLRHHLPLVDQNEINDEDVVILTLLRTAFPVLYARLPQWRDELIAGHTDELESTRPITFKPFDLASLFKAVPPPAQDDARALLQALFPKLNTGIQIQFPKAERRICDHQYFDRYFAMSVPRHDLADSSVAEAVVVATEGDGAALEAMLTHGSASRVHLALEKARRVTTAFPIDLEGDRQRLAMIPRALPLFDRLPDEPGNFSHPRMLMAGWMADTLNQLSPAVQVDAIVEALASAPDLEVQVRILRNAEQSSNGPIPWKAAVAQALNRVLSAAYLEQLRLGDDAPEDDGLGWMVRFLADWDEVDSLAQAVAVGIADGEFTLEDVASRCVVIDRISGGAPRLRQFDQDQFNQLVRTEEDSWFELPAKNVDATDLSWSNRRAFATSQAKQLENNTSLQLEGLPS
ncbi:KAP family NTPase [Glycomyces scopariae]